MTVTPQIAKHFYEVFFGGNWTASNLKEQLKNVTWQQATTKVNDLNTIATLAHHMSYYVSAVLKVLEGGPLIAKDANSFEHPPINSKEDWEAMKNNIFKDAEAFAKRIEALSDSILFENFVDEKYGIYYRNLHGIIEHSHYHLGQIAIIKKLLKK